MSVMLNCQRVERQWILTESSRVLPRPRLQCEPPLSMHYLTSTLRIFLATFLLGACAKADDGWAEIPIESNPSLKIQGRAGEETSWSSGTLDALQGVRLELKVPQPERAEAIRWFQILPDTSRFYKNANHPWEPEAYKWVGFGEITYERRELIAYRDQWSINLDLPKALEKASSSTYYRPDLGSFWIQVEVLKDGQRLRSAGLEENDDRNLTPKVFRLSIRKDDGYLGYLTSFFNVPGLFGSIPYQSNNYIGVDCADVLVAARRKWRGESGSKDYNVAMLVSEWKRVASFSMQLGSPEREMKWGEDLRPGDVIAVRYAEGKPFQHIGALYGDSNENGILDGRDQVLHAGPQALHLTPLRRGSFDGDVVVLRP